MSDEPSGNDGERTAPGPQTDETIEDARALENGVTNPHVPSPWTAHQTPRSTEPPLYDPYAFATPDPPRRSRLALSSVLSLLVPGPVGSIMAIVFGLYARREIERPSSNRTGHGLATLGIVLGLCATMGYGAMLSYFVWTSRHRFDPAGDEIAEGPEATPRAPSWPSARSPVPPPDLGPFAPKHTKSKRQSDITIVDIGSSTAALAGELAKQRAEAAAAGETLVVMTTASRCDPCRGVDRALVDPLMQTALARVRLVRVDIFVFHEDLVELKIPDEAIPGFFLLAPDLTPRDGVDGGEWDDDIAQNIAPVLGPFIRGKYAQRRRPWKPVPPSGMAL